MKTIIRRKKKHKLFEDDAQQQLQQPAQQPQLGQQPQQPAQGGLQPANGQQLGLNNAPDINTCIANVNNFIGTLFQQLQQLVKNNLLKSVPELDAFIKDTQSPYAAEAKKVSDAFGNFTKAEIKPDDANAVEKGIENFNKFIQDLTIFNTESIKIAEKQAQEALQQGGQQGGDLLQQQPAQNGQQPAAPQGGQQQLPAQGAQPLQENYDTNGFGKRLYENLYREHMNKQLEPYNYF